MSHARQARANGEVRIARFNYLAESIPHSLYRNGNVSLTRNPDGTDAGMIGYQEDARDMEVRDARIEEAGARGLHINGFELRHQRLEHEDIDFLNHEDVVKRHYPNVWSCLRK